MSLCNPMDCSLPGSSVHPWNLPSKNTEVDSHFLLQGIFPVQGWKLCLRHCRQILSTEPLGKPQLLRKVGARQFHPLFSSSVFLLLHLHRLDDVLKYHSPWIDSPCSSLLSLNWRLKPTSLEGVLKQIHHLFSLRHSSSSPEVFLYSPAFHF